MDYDIIGDVHGHADALAGLLDKMGYSKRNGMWRQYGHTAIFVGDFIDRGPGQLGTLDIVRPMVDEGAALAVMGNHEFNAIAWHTPDPDPKKGDYLREHSEKNQKQHQAFLDDTAGKPEVVRDVLNWFYKLPLWIDLPELRVVHACWHPNYMEVLAPRLEPGRRLNEGLVEAASRGGSPEFNAIEAILKGPEAKLPDGLSFTMGDEKRYEARTRWWDADAVTFRESAIVDDATRPLLPNIEVPAELRFGYKADKPVFIGHYWMRGHTDRLPLGSRALTTVWPKAAHLWLTGGAVSVILTQPTSSAPESVAAFGISRYFPHERTVRAAIRTQGISPRLWTEDTRLPREPIFVDEVRRHACSVIQTKQFHRYP